MFETLTVETDVRGVATVTLNRPDKHNALSAVMIAEMTQAAAQLAQDDAVRVVVLTGAGKSFCAGGDLGWMQDQMAMDGPTRAAEAGKLALQGNAFGGGVGMACICDVTVGVDHLKMGLTETRLGLIPATIGPYVLFGASEAVELGLLARAVPEHDLEEAVAREVDPYLSCAPGAVAAAKALARDLGPAIDQAVIAQTIAALSARWESPEAAEGISAFFEKRKATWMA